MHTWFSSLDPKEEWPPVVFQYLPKKRERACQPSVGDKYLHELLANIKGKKKKKKTEPEENINLTYLQRELQEASQILLFNGL